MFLYIIIDIFKNIFSQTTIMKYKRNFLTSKLQEFYEQIVVRKLQVVSTSILNHLLDLHLTNLKIRISLT